MSENLKTETSVEMRRAHTNEEIQHKLAGLAAEYYDAIRQADDAKLGSAEYEDATEKAKDIQDQADRLLGQSE